MSYTIKYHPAIAGDLNIIAEVIAEYAGPRIAIKKLEQIETAVLRLRDTPKTGSIRNEFGPHVRAIPAGRKGVVVFEVDDSTTTVFVLAITYGGADWVSRFIDRKTP